MRLIKPYTEVIELKDTISILKHIETVGRTCYKSEDKITKDSYLKFIRMLINKNHEAMLEHNLITIQLHGPRASSNFMNLKLLTAKIKELDTYDNRFMNFTFDIENQRYIISANLRVFRDLYKFYKNHSPIIGLLINFLIDEGFKIIFEDLDINKISSNAELFEFIKNTTKLTSLERLYHESISIKFVCDRGVSHELVRHRVASFAQESTRYCNYGKDEHITFIIPNWLNIKEGIYKSDDIIQYKGEGNWFHSMIIAENYYNTLIKENWLPGQARSVLPNSLKTEIIITMNLRGWKHFFDMRLPTTAHEQMRELTIPLYERYFKNIYENM
jgi:thymidylate synthase (FAD)